ncbi:MAG: hypothetical protein JNK82_33110 [Myxococcaceae bacterium]|nr:hypothetical protein [Myxococcaceae bacterium]
MRTSRRLLVPAALAVAACSSPPHQPERQCSMHNGFDACWPDGGFVCEPECLPLTDSDGGYKVNASGVAECQCLV